MIDPVVVSQWMTLIIQTGSVVGLIYALIRFTGTPNATQNQRLTALETWQTEVNKRLEDGDRKFSTNKTSTRVTMEALLALLSHALDGNNTDDLKKAVKEINTYLLEK